MSDIATLVLTKGIGASIITIIIAFIGFTLCSFFGLDTTGMSYVAPFVGMWFAVSVGNFSLDVARKGDDDDRFFANTSNMKVVMHLTFLNLLVFFFVTGFAMPFLFRSSFSPRSYYGISYSAFMILGAIEWYSYALLRFKFILNR